ncbi:uncharacterized protein LOC128956747 [Oppia nitens]|uniref:uncharacterized protein LOC128956747 n=1 Tax=Oppia nitens TaxID=1686743 RepID=UPI0023DA4FE8|nr:uncharacterized protein LOC128956747 [Oppia nitens]
MKSSELWAYKFLDASGKIPAAILEGVLTSFGDYDQCLAIKSSELINTNNEDNSRQHIYGRYCLIRPYVQINDYRIIEDIAKKYLLTNNENYFNLTIGDIKKHLNTLKILSTLNLLSNNFYLFNYGLCIPSQCDKHDIKSALNKLVNPIINLPIEIGPNKCDTVTDTIELNQFQLVIVFVLNLIKDIKYFWLRIFFYRDMVVFLSGVIISYDYFGKHQSIPVTVWQYMKFVAEKWLRFMPKMFAPIIVITIMSMIGNGPGWHIGRVQFVDACSQTYWHNLLFMTFLENDLTKSCNQMSGVISMIFDLQILSPIFMLPFTKSPKFGYIFNTLALIPAFVAKILPNVLFGTKLIPYEAADSYLLDNMRYSVSRSIIYPDQYLSLFIIGIMLGYSLRNRHKYRFLQSIYRNIYLRSLSAMICLSTSPIYIYGMFSA